MPLALSQSLIILRSLFSLLVGQRYMTSNPIMAVALLANAQRQLGFSHVLSFLQRGFLQRGFLQPHAHTEVG